jgi:hypothetical protein
MKHSHPEKITRAEWLRWERLARERRQASPQDIPPQAPRRSLARKILDFLRRRA